MMKRADLLRRGAGLLLASALCAALAAPGALAAARTVSIGTAAEWAAFAGSCARDSWSRDKVVLLTGDLDLSSLGKKAVVPTFGGELRGGGHTVKGLRLSGKGSQVGLFRYLQEGGAISGLTVEGCAAPEGSRASVALLVGENSGLIQDCAVSGSVSGGTDVGGVAGVNMETGRLERCVSGAAVTGAVHTGGVVGRSAGTVSQCRNNGTVNTESPSGDAPMGTGGIVGRNDGTVLSCVNQGAVGYQHTGYHTGGIAGESVGNLISCQNLGYVQGRKGIGGILGQFEPYTELNYADASAQLTEELDALSALLNQFCDQVSGAAAGGAADLSGINDALGSITGTAEDAGGDARATLDAVLASARKINAALGRFLTAGEDALDDLDSQTDAISRQLEVLRGALGSAAEQMEACVSTLRAQREALNGHLETISGYLQQMETFAKTVSDLLKDETLSAGERLEQIKDAYAAMGELDFSGQLSGINGCLRRMGQAAETLADSLRDDWEDSADPALGRLQKALDELGDTVSGLGHTATEQFSVMNRELDVIGDALDAARANEAGISADIYDRLDEISAGVTRITNGVQTTTSDLNRTRNAITGQLDRVRDSLLSLTEPPELNVDDRSDSAEAEGTQGKAVACENQGAVNGDSSVGGIAGLVAWELDLDPEEDPKLPDNLTVDTTAVVKATIRDCVNRGAVAAKNDNAGGIVGRAEVGAVLDSMSFAPVEAGAAGCGGVAGLSKSVIRRCYALCALTGTDDVGGIAGRGRDIQDCRSMVRIDADGECLGAVAGAADGELSGNFFLEEEWAGVDGIDYEGKAVPLAYAEFSRLEGLPVEFTTFTVTFRVNGRDVKTLSTTYGGSVSEADYPALPEKEGYTAAWSGFDPACILRSVVVEAEYTPLASTLATEEDQPRLLVEGAFSPTAELDIQDWTPSEALLPGGYTCTWSGSFTLADNGQELQGEVPLRLRCPAGEKAALLGADGALEWIDGERDGSYLRFSAPSGSRLATLAPPSRLPVLLAAGGGAAVLVLGALAFRRKKGRGGPPAPSPMGEDKVPVEK